MSIAPKLVESAYAHMLPYWWIGDGVLVLHDGALVVGYRLTGVDVDTQPDSSVNALAGHLRQFLSALPIQYQLQFLRRYRTLDESVLEAYERSLGTSHPILLEQRRRTAEHLRRQNLRAIDSYLFISDPTALGRLGSHNRDFISQLFDRLTGRKNPLSITREIHERKVEDLKQQSSSLVRHLGGAGIKVSPLGDQDLADVVFAFLNPSQARAPELVDEPLPPELPEEQRKLFRALSLREQLVRSSLTWQMDVLGIDDPVRLHRVVGLHSLPPRTQAGFFVQANRIPFPHWLSVGIGATDTEKRFDDVEKRRNKAQAMAVGHARNVKASMEAGEMESVMEAMVGRNQRVYSTSLHVLFSADDLVELDRRTHQLIDTFRVINVGVATEQQAQLFGFLGMLPGNAHRAPHRRTVLTDNAADLLPVYDASIGDVRPTFMVQTRNGEPFQIDLTDPKRTNWNGTVFGGSGGGKTFLTLSLATSSMLGQGGPLIVIDVGGKELGSYYRLCNLLGGDFIDLSLDGSNAINPFFSREDLFTTDEGLPSTSPNELKLSFLLTIAELLVTDPGAKALSRVARAVLQRAILATYEAVGSARPPIFSDLAVQLERATGDVDEIQLARGFARTLKAALESPFGKVINQQSRVNIRSSFVVFDVKGLESIGDYATVMLIIISAYVWNMISKPRRELAWVIYDECWKLLMNETAAALQSELYRTARKLKCGVISITQKLEDFLAAPASKAILSNSTTTFLLKHKDGHEKVAELLSLNERELQLFKKLTTEKGRFSEFFLKQENVSALCRYAPSAFEYWVNTTDPSDRALEGDVLKQVGGDRLATLRRLVKEYPNGAAGGPRKVTHA